MKVSKIFHTLAARGLVKNKSQFSKEWLNLKGCGYTGYKDRIIGKDLASKSMLNHLFLMLRKHDQQDLLTEYRDAYAAAIVLRHKTRNGTKDDDKENTVTEQAFQIAIRDAIEAREQLNALIKQKLSK